MFRNHVYFCSVLLLALSFQGCGGGGAVGKLLQAEGDLEVAANGRCPVYRIVYEGKNYGLLQPGQSIVLKSVPTSGKLNICETSQTPPAVNTCTGRDLSWPAGASRKVTLTCEDL